LGFVDLINGTGDGVPVNLKKKCSGHKVSFKTSKHPTQIYFFEDEAKVTYLIN
jgi:hypothetical protein